MNGLISNKEEVEDLENSQKSQLLQEDHKKNKKTKKKKIVLNVSGNHSLPDTQYSVVRYVGKKLLEWKLQYDSQTNDWDVYWTDKAVQPQFLAKMQYHQKVNHFPGMYSLARKNNLAKNLIIMKKRYPEFYQFFPQTWLIPVDYRELRAQYQNRQKGKVKTFIVKPQASCQGRGIFLTRNIIDDIDPKQHYVIQRYLHKPYLIEGLKFDLRIYVLLAGCDPMRIYLYKQGLTRLATQIYMGPKNDNLDNLCMHLTNYAINKDNPNFIFNQSTKKMDKGHKRSLTSTFKQLQSQGKNVEKLKDDIKELIIRTFVAGYPTLKHHYNSCQSQNFSNNMCFEILGFDILLDHSLKPYLLQINHTPSFSTETPLDKIVKESVIKDTFVLLNITQKAKNQILTRKHKQTQERMITGKRKKYTPEQKEKEIVKWEEIRNEWEDKHIGNFEKIYPTQTNKNLYDLEMEYAQEMYEIKSGFKKQPKLQIKKILCSITESKNQKFNKKLQLAYKLNDDPKESTRYCIKKNKVDKEQILLKNINQNFMFQEDFKVESLKCFWQNKVTGSFLKPKTFQIDGFQKKMKKKQ